MKSWARALHLRHAGSAPERRGPRVSELVDVLGRKERTMLSRSSNRRGQGLAEYLIVLALVCLFLVFIVSEYGTTIRVIFEGSEEKVSIAGKKSGGLDKKE